MIMGVRVIHKLQENWSKKNSFIFTFDVMKYDKTIQTNFKTKQHSVKRDIHTPNYQYLLILQFECSGFLKILHI